MKFCEKQRLIGFHHKALHFSSKEKLSPGQSNDKTTYHKSHHLSMIPFQKSRALEQSPDRTELEQDHIFSINRLFVSCGSFLWLPLLTYMCDFINITIHQPWISFFINHKKNRCWKTKFTCCRQDWYTYIYIHTYCFIFLFIYRQILYVYIQVCFQTHRGFQFNHPEPFSIQDSLGSLVTELMALTLVPLAGPGYGAGRLLVSTTFFNEGWWGWGFPYESWTFCDKKLCDLSDLSMFHYYPSSFEPP